MSALKAGGGTQLALNFLSSAAQDGLLQQRAIVLVPDSGPLVKSQQRFPGLRIETAPSTRPTQRALFERRDLQVLYREHNVRSIFTFFGAGLPHPRDVRSVVSVAYPIICYPDSPYWRHINWKTRARQRLINRVRVQRLKAADRLVVETSVMRDRLSELLSRPLDEFIILPPTPSMFVSESNRAAPTTTHAPTFLVLSGVAPHKNLWRLPELAAALKPYLSDFKFLISCSELTYRQSLTEQQTDLYERHHAHFEFAGTVAPDDISRLYNRADFLLSLSDLESFSNNYMEAWKAGVPQVASDRDFARSILQDSAVFVEPHDPTRTAQTIAQFLQDPTSIARCVQSGKRLLGRLPDEMAKVRLIKSLFDSPV